VTPKVVSETACDLEIVLKAGPNVH
jgi:hypothetical protein